MVLVVPLAHDMFREVLDCSVTVPEAQSHTGSMHVIQSMVSTHRFYHIWLAFYHIPPTHGKHAWDATASAHSSRLTQQLGSHQYQWVVPSMTDSGRN